ncbi:glycosyltransferase [Streptococcus thermophilus]|nr:glycosyltransferase [Streptococcus thermophilus]MCE2168441.1 glycosyltransferase [Streptococcus thermophilus]MCE2174840.1 glycosyltransferase [Streptococcus thermophilus]
MISIIVPVYNVEKYIDRCINSIMSQTYTDWELLLIDDGSTDRSGDICEEYALRDKRIKCFHKANGGQSSARNLGLVYSNGEQIVFCDSDDWLSKDFLSICIEEYEKFDADIVTTNYYIYDDKKCIQSFDGGLEIEICNNERAMKKLLENDGTSSSVCGRIYKKELFDNIRFEDGMLFEDAAISYKIFIQAQIVVFISQPLMYYFQREGSTMSRRDKKIRMDEIHAAHMRYEEVRKLYSNEISEAAFSNYVYDFIHVFECFIRDGFDLSDIKYYDSYLRGELGKYSYKFGKLFSIRKKVESFLWLRFPTFFEKLVVMASYLKQNKR